MSKYFTNTTNDNVTHNVCVDDLLTISRAMHDQFINQFTGVKIMVYSHLKGKSWHVAVSQQLYDEIIEYEKKIKEI